MRTEVHVRIKNQDGSLCLKYKESELIEDLTLSETDERMQIIVNKALAEFKGKPDEIVIKTHTYV